MGGLRCTEKGTETSVTFTTRNAKATGPGHAAARLPVIAHARGGPCDDEGTESLDQSVDMHPTSLAAGAELFLMRSRAEFAGSIWK